MSEELTAKVLGFLAEEFSRKDERQCIRVELEYAQPGGFRPEPLRSWVRADTPDLFDTLTKVEELARTIVELAEEHADAFGQAGSHRFKLRTRQHMSGIGLYTFKISPSYEGNDENSTALATRGAPPGNEMVQAMGVVTQNNLALMRSNQSMFTAAFGPLAQICNNMQAENAKLSAENLRLSRELDEARSTKQDREFEIAMKMEAAQRKGKSIDKVMQIGTVIAAKIAGGNGEGAGASEAIMMIARDLRASLRQEQYPALMRALDQGQQMMVAELLRLATPADEQDPGQGRSTNGANGTAHHPT